MTRMQYYPKFICFVLFLLTACVNEGVKEEANQKKTTDFIPDIQNYDFFIEGEIEKKLLRYRQINYGWTNVSNKYFKNYEQTWLQAYTDSLDHTGSWNIRFSKLNIESIPLPHVLKSSDGNIIWYDSRVDLIIKNANFCQGVDNGCTFSLSPKNGNIVITKVKDQIIEGNFEGKAIVVRTGFTPGHIDSLFHEIKNGKFRIKYRVE